ncbi:sialate O-acetylesterase [Adhaeribacter arboris]|uniref:Sialate O-acetylesterase n=1 Tax=Adhaeribacter arboris TaxID=2072846 RepID=A0A2T2Y9S3_9BACT|nr:sialate O-acetylesterase [Adhaeribacter arboris]PSR52262.1 sialate O-acetylesterase [Adhaeribacter arboris]
MEKLLLLLAFCSLISCKPQLTNKRTQFFPKAELKVKDLPEKENTWVFILAGQSNMAGRGQVEPADTIPHERIFTINQKGEVIMAKEPLHFYEPNNTGLGSGLSFAKTLIKQVPESVSILLIPTAVGGSSISQWLGDSTHRQVKLLTNFKEKAAIGKSLGQVKAILWHQGESDAHPEDIPLYKTRLINLLSQFREILGDKNLPIVLGELGTFSKDTAEWEQINEQIQQYSSSDPYSSVVRTSDLNHKGDNIHFDSKGQRLMGQRYAQAYIQLQKKLTNKPGLSH